jgi:hypothetical protein
LIKDYDCEINYHLGKANVVVDALSQKSTVALSALGTSQPQLIMELERFRIEVIAEGIPALVCSMMAQPELLERIKAAQIDDTECLRIKKNIEEGR